MHIETQVSSTDVCTASRGGRSSGGYEQTRVGFRGYGLHSGCEPGPVGDSASGNVTGDEMGRTRPPERRNAGPRGGIGFRGNFDGENAALSSIRAPPSWADVSDLRSLEWSDPGREFPIQPRKLSAFRAPAIDSGWRYGSPALDLHARHVGKAALVTGDHIEPAGDRSRRDHQVALADEPAHGAKIGPHAGVNPCHGEVER